MKKELLNLKNNILKLYWINAIASTNFHMVVYTIFLLAKGFSMQQFFLIGAVYSIFALLSEIPTGAFSDRISRKASLILTSIISIPVDLIFILSNNFTAVLIASAFGAIASSFTSGTDESMLYDTLKSIKQEKDYKKINGKLKWYGAWAGAIGGIIGGILAQYQLVYAWWAMFVVSIIAMIIKFSLAEPLIERKSETYLRHIKESLKQAFTGKAAYFVLYYAIIWTFFVFGFFFWQPYLKLISLPILYFGFFYAAERLISGFASKQADKVESILGIKASLFLIPVVLALSFILESQFIFIFGFLFIFLQSLASGYFNPVLNDYANREIVSTKRATVLSIRNMSHSLLYAIASPFLGYYTDLYSLQTALLLMGILLIVLSLFFLFLYRGKNNHSTPE